MRHRKHRHQLGRKKEHRIALMANMAAALLRHGRIQTTLAKAKALRPFTEKIITLAKRAHGLEDRAKWLHLYRLAISRVRDKEAVKILFDERAEQFLNRPGGYTRIYKLVPRQNDAAPMAIIELIDADDEGYTKPKRRSAKATKREAEPEAAESDANEPEMAGAGETSAEADPATAEPTEA